MAHWVSTKSGRRCQSEKGKFLPNTRCGKAAAKKSKTAKRRKHAKKATKHCNAALGKRAVKVIGHGRHCPGHARRR